MARLASVALEMICTIFDRVDKKEQNASCMMVYTCYSAADAAGFEKLGLAFPCVQATLASCCQAFAVLLQWNLHVLTCR